MTYDAGVCAIDSYLKYYNQGYAMCTAILYLVQFRATIEYCPPVSLGTPSDAFFFGSATRLIIGSL